MTRWILRLLLALAPAAFRERHGNEMLEVHAERASRRQSPISRAFFGIREVAGLTRTVLGLRVARTRATARGTMTTTMGGAAMLETTRQDLRFAIRTLTRNPGFTAAVTAVLALGIGANTAIFSAANAFFFRPLPFADADRLVMLYETNPEFGWTHAHAAPANALDWREQVQAFDDVALYDEFLSQATVQREGEPELLSYTQVTGNFFSVLGVQPALGTGLRWENTWEGEAEVVVLSHAAWVTHFGGDPDIVGRRVGFGVGRSAEVVGVMPEGFSFPNDRTQAWAPWGWPAGNREEVFFRRAHWVRPIARLAPGVSAEKAGADFQVVVSRLQVDFPATNRIMGAGLMPLRDFLVMDVRKSVMVLMGAVALLLLLSCTNVANLMLVRASQRTREVALRFALGAARRRVARQMLTESLVLGAVGGALGLGIGWVSVKALSLQQRVGIGGATELELDYRVVLFTIGAALASSLLFGVGPALRASSGGVQEALKDGGRGGSAGRIGLRTANLLVSIEVALALLLVVGAGLMTKSFWLLRRVDPGFRSEGTLAVRFSLPEAPYSERDQVLAFQDDFLRRLEGRAGIERAGMVALPPLMGPSWSSQLLAEGWPPERVGFEILHRRADRGYFEALEIPLLRGRLFGPDDRPGAPLVVVVNETFAREHFPGEDPIGQRITYDRVATPESNWYEIVGIVGDAHQISPSQATRAEVYEHRLQDWARSQWVVVRTNGDAFDALPVLRGVLREMDPLLPVAEARSLAEVWRTSLARERLLLTLFGAFGIAALVLAAVGVYGVTAQAARRRTREIGIRMALGAEAQEVLRMMLRQGLVVVGLGLAVGVGTALAVTRLMTFVLYGVSPSDAATLVGMATLLGAVALAACWIPARRATRVDPVTSLGIDA